MPTSVFSISANVSLSEERSDSAQCSRAEAHRHACVRLADMHVFTGLDNMALCWLPFRNVLYYMSTCILWYIVLYYISRVASQPKGREAPPGRGDGGAGSRSRWPPPRRRLGADATRRAILPSIHPASQLASYLSIYPELAGH